VSSISSCVCGGCVSGIISEHWLHCDCASRSGRRGRRCSTPFARTSELGWGACCKSESMRPGEHVSEHMACVHMACVHIDEPCGSWTWKLDWGNEGLYQLDGWKGCCASITLFLPPFLLFVSSLLSHRWCAKVLGVPGQEYMFDVEIDLDSPDSAAMPVYVLCCREWFAVTVTPDQPRSSLRRGQGARFMLLFQTGRVSIPMNAIQGGGCL
jgi:hypothetical protein